MKLHPLRTVLCILALLSATEASAQSEDSFAKPFQYSETCDQLLHLSRVELVGTTHLAYEEHFGDFCKVAGVYRCEDYNALLLGQGQLEDNGQSSCRYLPLRK